MDCGQVSMSLSPSASGSPVKLKATQKMESHCRAQQHLGIFDSASLMGNADDQRPPLAGWTHERDRNRDE